MLKVLNYSFSSEIVLPSSFRIILSLFEFLFEKVGTTVLQNALLSVTFLVSRLLKYSFLVVLKGFLQKLRCILHCFLYVKDLDLKYLFLNLDRFIISLCKFFVIKGASFSRIYFFLIGAYLLKAERIVSLKLFIFFVANAQVFMSA